MKQLTRLLFTGVLLASSSLLLAKELIMVRSGQPFPETMSTLQEIIRQHGYTVSRVQRVDIGLTKMGYKTDKYRVVFYGKKDELKKLTQNHPEIIPYLPLKIAIFSEETQTLLVSYSPDELALMFPDKDLAPYFATWTKDLTLMMQELQQQTRQ